MDQALELPNVNWADGFMLMPCKLTFADSALPAIGLEFTASNTQQVTSVMFVGEPDTLRAFADGIVETINKTLAAMEAPDDNRD